MRRWQRNVDRRAQPDETIRRHVCYDYYNGLGSASFDVLRVPMLAA